MSALPKIMMLGLFTGLLMAGCGKDGSEPGTMEESPDIQLVAGNQTLCPIMDNPINKDIFMDYQGKRIYFCCEGCNNTFKEDPEKYIKQMEDEGIVLTTIVKK